MWTRATPLTTRRTPAARWRTFAPSSDQVYAGLRALVEAAPESALTDPAYFGLRADIVPWELIAGNGYEHYHEHIPGIRAWLDAVPA